jgi:hypothetical protein
MEQYCGGGGGEGDGFSIFFKVWEEILSLVKLISKDMEIKSMAKRC